MNKPTVIPIAIWIMDAATLKTIELRPSVVSCYWLARDAYKTTQSTYVSSCRASDKCRRCLKSRFYGSTGCKTARNLHVHSRQEYCSGDAVSHPTVKVGKDTNSESSKSVGNRCGGCELHVGEKIDGVSCRSDQDHGRHLLVLCLHCESDKEHV